MTRTVTEAQRMTFHGSEGARKRKAKRKPRPFVNTVVRNASGDMIALVKAGLSDEELQQVKDTVSEL